MRIETRVANDLAVARSAVGDTDADPLPGWAWAESDYRLSPKRAFGRRDRPLTVSHDGLLALERAMETLLRDQRVQTKWRVEDLWTTVLSLLAAASTNDAIDLPDAVLKLVRPAPVRIAAAIANVVWASGPLQCGPITLANIGSLQDAEAVADLIGLKTADRRAFFSHAEQLLAEFESYVVATAATPRQDGLAHDDFNRGFEDLIGLILLFSDALDDFGIYSLRGAVNRPGIRGITLGRGALATLLEEKGAGELAARLLVMTGRGSGNTFQWCGADPMPLDRLLDGDLHILLSDLIDANDAIAQRLRVAARWYARAFWADSQEDSALAVSVALDSMLTGKDALPGAVSKGRFAFLERDLTLRSDRFDRYEQVYKVRSAIAHGGDATRSLEKIGGARSILRDARWVARQLLALRDLSTPMDDDAFRALWAALQWGTLSWSLR